MAKSNNQRPLHSYEHTDKDRLNNPPVGLVTPETDPDDKPKTYAYDPHLDPQLTWAGKAEHTSFEVPTVSLHVHERIDPRTIIEAVRKQEEVSWQPSLFAAPTQNPTIRQAIEFYKHKHGWTNRLVAGDSLLIMNSLIEKEGLAGHVQMIYFDPPYGIKYQSNFQPFVNKRNVKDRKDEDLSQEPEMIRAFRDTWELGIHSYLTYIRDRLLLAKDLLAQTGSIFIQIGDQNIHLIRAMMDEVFGNENFCSMIAFEKTSGLTQTLLPAVSDYLLWYAKSIKHVKFHQIFQKKVLGSEGSVEYVNLELPDGITRRLSADETSNPSLIPQDARVFAVDSIVSGGTTPTEYQKITLKHNEKIYVLDCGAKRNWKAGYEGTIKLWQIGRLVRREGLRIYKRYFNDFPYKPFTNIWTDTRGETEMLYVVQTSRKVIERCLLMTTDPGDLVLDITCGSGTTAYIAEQWGRRWITCDTSRIAITLSKQRLMTSVFDYYELARPDEGVGSGFRYKTVPHITLKSIANNSYIHESMTRAEIETMIVRHADQETLYDQPYIDKARTRVTGPFTVEAVPAPTVKSLDEIEADQVLISADASLSRSGETLRQAQWRDELLKTGIRGTGGHYIKFSRVEPLAGVRWLHADAETKEEKPERAVISFGPEHAPLETRQVEYALEEAQTLVPRPKLVIFASFHFDSEAAKDIDAINWPGIRILRTQMNADLLTEDLKKKRANNDSFWLIGQPDAEPIALTGKDEGKYSVIVRGFDYYNTRTGSVEPGGINNIAMWMLDPDYDGRSLFPRQVFFPMAGDKDGWAKLARNLKAEIDLDLIEFYKGTTSLPFTPGQHRRAAVKIIDDRGIESIKVMPLP